MAKNQKKRKIDYKIVPDTNVLFFDKKKNLDQVFRSELGQLSDFLEGQELSNVVIAIPEIVFEERIHQRLDDVRAVMKKMEELVDELNTLKVKASSPKEPADLEGELRKEAKDYLDEKGVQILENPEYDVDILIDRALKKSRPFNKKDKGFKDTLIWLSILHDAAKNNNVNYILCTENQEDFSIEELLPEFEERSDGELYIVSNPKEAKELLDDKLVLKLELQKLHKEISNEVKKNIGDLMAKFNVYVLGRVRHEGSWSSMSTVTLTRNVQREVSGYNFIGLEISDVFRLDVGIYSVRALLTTEPISRTKYENSWSTGITRDVALESYDYHSDSPENWDISFVFNRTTGGVEIEQVNKNIPPSSY